MSPKDIFNKLIFFMYTHGRASSYNKPGALLSRLSSEDRNILAGLSPDDLSQKTEQDQYWKDCAQSAENDNNKAYKEALVDFDKKILK